VALAFLLYVVLEIAAIAAVAWAIGAWTILLLVVGAVVGALVARHEGGKALRSFNGAVRAGGSPHAELTDGILIGAGGLLILIPGFISDVAGFGFLLPPTRGLLRRRWVARLEGRSPDSRNRNSRGRIVVDSEVVDPARSASSRPRPGARRSPGGWLKRARTGRD
jgi:UPF0716 protein FxsA